MIKEKQLKTTWDLTASLKLKRSFLVQQSHGRRNEVTLVIRDFLKQAIDLLVNIWKKNILLRSPTPLT